MPSSRREELLASAGDQALAAWLGRLQDASFSRAGAVRKAYPPERRVRLAHRPGPAEGRIL